MNNHHNLTRNFNKFKQKAQLIIIYKFYTYIWNLYRNSRIAHDAITLVVGGAIGNIIVLAISPILSRLYTPSDLGIFSMFSSMLGLITTIICMRYELAIPIAKNEKSALSLLLISIVIASLFSIFLICVLWMSYALIGNMFASNLTNALWILPLSSILSGYYIAFTSYVTRHLRYGHLACARIAQGLSFAAAGITFGAFGLGAVGLVSAQTLRYVPGNILLIILIKSIYKSYRNIPTIREIIKLAYQWRRFPQRLVPAALLNTLALQLPTLVFPWLYGLHLAGQYGLIQITLIIPSSFIGQSLSKVFIGHASHHMRKNPNQIFHLTFRMLLFTGSLGIILILIFVPFASIFYPVAFGSTWTEAGLFATILAPAAAIGIVSGSISSLIVLLQKTSWQLRWDIGRFGMILASLVYVGIMNKPAIYFLLILSFIYSIFYIINIFMVWKICHVNFR